MEILIEFAALALFICVIGFFNEKVTKFPYEIALLLYASIIGLLLVIGLYSISDFPRIHDLIAKIEGYDMNSFLVEGVLCFMLFAGSCHHKMKDIKNSLRHITVLAFVCTLLGALFYAGLFYGGTKLLGINLSIPVCLMLGSIIAPSDPIAATGILKKFGLPKKISFLIETEALFNDGVGVALFVCFFGMVKAQASPGKETARGFFTVMLQEIGGAAIVAIIVTAICFFMFKRVKNNILRIVISLLNVSLAYSICEENEFSGALCIVICGIMFATLRSNRIKDEDEEDAREFDSFWETLDGLLNSLLYVMLGFSFTKILGMHVNLWIVLALSVIAIVANLISRALGLSISTLFMGKLPDNYDKISFIKLFTWAGLRGGLSVALAMSTKDVLSKLTEASGGKIEYYNIILGCTFAVVFFTTVIQGLTMTPVYNRIKKKVESRNAQA